MSQTARRILKQYNVNIHTICPNELYERVFDNANEIREGLVKELKNIPDSLRLH